MKIINGQDLKEMFVSGANNLYNHYPEVDALNVFPVPDGDTGMNMNLTMTSGSKEIRNRNDTNIYEISKAFSRGLLMGARGNSGVITSQIWRGFSMGLEGKEEIDIHGLDVAFQKAVEIAYKAVIKPVEGTILTVIKDSANYLNQHIDETNSIEKAFELLINEAKKSLENTPNLLPILKEVGVVDSGGAGLVHIFEGMLSALKGQFIERQELSLVQQENLVAAGASLEDEEFGYCTEFIMSLGPDAVKKPFNEKRFTDVLLSRGNSLVVVRDEDIVKVHVHTLNPGTVLNYAQQFGEFLKLKIENMTEQHRALEEGALKAEDVHHDLIDEPKKEIPHVKNAFIAVASSAEIGKIFKELGASQIIEGGQTMNPSAQDFIKAMDKVNADHIYLLPNNGNIVLAASQAAEMSNKENTVIHVIPTKTIPQGIACSAMFDADGEDDENVDNMTDTIDSVKSGEVTFSIRDSEINGVKIKKDEFIGIFDGDIIYSHRKREKVLLELISQMVDEDSTVITLFYGSDVTDEDAEKLQNTLLKKYPDCELELIDGNQPVYSYIVGVQ